MTAYTFTDADGNVINPDLAGAPLWYRDPIGYAELFADGMIEDTTTDHIHPFVD